MSQERATSVPVIKIAELALLAVIAVLQLLTLIKLPEPLATRQALRQAKGDEARSEVRESIPLVEVFGTVDVSGSVDVDNTVDVTISR